MVKTYPLFQIEILFSLDTLANRVTLLNMETKTLTYTFRITDEQREKLRRVADFLRRKDADAVRILIEDKYSEISGLEQREQVPA